MDLFFIGDGPRDSAVIPHLVSNILNEQVKPSFKAWKEIRLDRGTGYTKKLKFAIAEARTSGLFGVVATVDKDTEPRRARLTQLITARTEDRNKPIDPIPIAVGEADRNVEAWLIDDEKAVRDSLGLDAAIHIPSVRSGDPKAILDKIIEDSDLEHRRMDLLPQIACAVSLARCLHKDETGLQEFKEDVEAEFNQAG